MLKVRTFVVISLRFVTVMIAGMIGVSLIQGCGTIEPELEITTGDLSREMFIDSIQPILDQRGCSESQCHYRDKTDPNSGGPGGGFRIFNCEESSCTVQELSANYDSSIGMANLGTPSNSKLIQKPLAESEGGLQHLGGTIFFDANDSDYQSLLEWIQTPL